VSWRARSSRAAPALVAALVWLAFASVCAATRAEAFESLTIARRPAITSFRSKSPPPQRRASAG